MSDAGRRRATAALLLAALAWPLAAGADQAPAALAQVVQAVAAALPTGWRVVSVTPNQHPYGHHYCEKAYDGVTGTQLTVAGPTPVWVHWTTESGEARRSPVALEGIHLWFMPPSYRDARFAWLCLHRPVQPVEVLASPAVRVYGRTTHLLEPAGAFQRDVLPRASAISWPESPATDPRLISWSTWAQDVATAASAARTAPRAQ